MLTRLFEHLRAWREGLVTLLVLAGIVVFLFSFFRPGYLLLDTMTVGGDTPAHNYLASHLARHLAEDGRIISWAPGWWGGFPMYQFYFPLPYLLIAALDTVLPFNVAFKLVTVLGIFLLPLCAWAMARRMRLAHPVPLFFALAGLLFLFVTNHKMWGANIYSTLAGMIANSLSFALMLLFLGSAWRDAEDGRFRLRTTVGMCLLLASHFFTSVMAGLTVALFPFLFPRRFLRTALLLAAEMGLAALLMGWWLVPLVAKSAFSMEYGENWNVVLRETLPDYTPWIAVFVLLALVLGGLRREKPVAVFVWMLVAALALFYGGFYLSPVFVNVRLWPFLFFAFLALAALGAGLLLQRVAGVELLVIAAAIGTMVYIENLDSLSETPQAAADVTAHQPLPAEEAWQRVQTGVKTLIRRARIPRFSSAPCHVREWIDWNYSGLELKPYWPSFEKLILPLRGTPGRLANDLHNDNCVLGSSRIFESVPHLTGKPILEGGLVNSALGALYAYYIQGETSQASAGFPSLVQPASFDITNATRHLELYNVKHFIARWETTRQALRQSPEWKFLDEAQGWELFELTTHDGRYVFIPPCEPLAVRTRQRKEYGLEWMYTPGALREFFVFCPPEDGPPPPRAGPDLSEAQFRRLLILRRDKPADLMEWLHLGPFPCPRGPQTPIDYAAIDETRADPREGQKDAGRRWNVLFARPPIDLCRVHRSTTNYVAYSFANLFAPEDGDALLHLGNDDAAKVWLNGALVATPSITGFGNFRSVPVRLHKGRNRLLHKIEQLGGGCFFHVRVTDPDGQPIPGLVCTAANEPPELPDGLPRPTAPPPDAIRDEVVQSDRIRFHTEAVGLPHIVKVSYFPNWKVRGAARVYMVTPAFLLVYPEEPDVELYYGTTGSDRLGALAAIVGLLLLLGLLGARWRAKGMPVPFTRVALLKFTDAVAGLPLCWLLGHTRFLLSRAEPARADIRGHEPRRILVIRPGGMGDLILLLPVLDRLRREYPACQIDLVCERRNMEVLRIAGLQALAIPYDSQPVRLAWSLCRRRYDLAIDTEQFHHFSAIIAFLSGAPVRIGFKIVPARNLLYTHLVSYDPDGPEAAQFARLLDPLGLAGDIRDIAGLLREAPLPRPPGEALRSFLDSGPFVAVYPGSTTRYKHWGTARFLELVQRLAARAPLGVLLVGGRSDAPEAQAILRGVDPAKVRVHSCAGTLSLVETAAALREALLFIGGDSGLGHLAVALDTPTVLLFGPSDPKKWGRTDSRHRSLRRPLPCSPCFLFGYHRPCRAVACMEEIAVDEVIRACEQIAPLPPG